MGTPHHHFLPQNIKVSMRDGKHMVCANEDDIEEVLKTTEENIIIVDGRAYLC